MTAQRREWTERITTVRYIARPSGVGRENPPHLGDLREFVRICEGLPDDATVSIDQGSLSEGGRFDMTFSVRIVDQEEAS